MPSLRENHEPDEFRRQSDTGDFRILQMKFSQKDIGYPVRHQRNKRIRIRKTVFLPGFSNVSAMGVQ